MIVCSDDFFERLEKGKLSVIEKRRYLICQAVQAAMEDIPVFYSAQPQGVSVPAVFVRVAKMQYINRLANETECRMTFEVRYLARNGHDDIECENAMELLLDSLSGGSFDKETVFAERTEKGVTAKVVSSMRWKIENADDGGDLMRSLEMCEKEN